MKAASIRVLAAIFAPTVSVAFFAFAAPAVAVPITYSIKGIGSGTLDGTSFTDDLVSITIAGDTNNIVSLTSSVSKNAGPTTVSVAGVGTDTLPNIVDFVDRFPDEEFFGTPTGSPFWEIDDSAFATYNLDTSIGPVSGPPFLSKTPTVTGSGGNFDLSVMGTSTFEADVVPLPATLPLFATGLGAFGLLGWRRKRKSRVGGI
jgi:hypothetical protein